MPFIKLWEQGGNEVQLSGNNVEGLSAAIDKHGKIAVPNYALTYVMAFFKRRAVHIEMQKCKMAGDAAGEAKHATELDELQEVEDNAKDAYDTAVEKGLPDLGSNPLTGDTPVAQMAGLKVEAAAAAAADDEEEKLTKMQIKKMKPPELKSALKERGLSIQGNKSDLIARLMDHEGV
mmetsp:Transcript_22004/g.57448  ORF Transcript_22004/g.57448 Transcript_22004/m.57448 type:complete len:177 (+) Transcript_22004:52-582(+)